MDIDLSEEQVLLRESVERTAARSAAHDGRDHGAWEALVELGLAGILVDPDCGGLGGSAVDLSVVMECLGRNRVVCPMVASGVVAACLVTDLADERRKARMLDDLVSGRSTVAAVLPDSGRGGSSTGFMATAVEDGWHLVGRRSAVFWASQADILILGATVTAGGGDPAIALFLVPRDCNGLSISPRVSIDGTPMGTVVADLKLESDACLGIGEPVDAAIERALDMRDVALMADAVGAIDHLVEVTAEYCRTRKQFGKALSEFQALRHRMAEMAVLREEARAVLLLASIRATSVPADRRRAVLSARVKIGRAARHVAEEAVQLHGAMGVTEELDVGGYLKRLIQFELHAGSTERHARRLAEALRVRPQAVADGLLLSTAH